MLPFQIVHNLFYIDDGREVRDFSFFLSQVNLFLLRLIRSRYYILTACFLHFLVLATHCRLKFKFIHLCYMNHSALMLIS